MRHSYHALISYSEALALQSEAIQAGRSEVFGFEMKPVITLGIRARGEDLLAKPPGFEILKVDRGGQATLHNPGQLVIFPTIKIKGTRAWTDLLARTTMKTLSEFGVESSWDEAQPGLFTARGKIMACGFRVRESWSTHGIAINVRNDLTPFHSIRACGVSHAPLDRMGLEFELQQIFARWVSVFRATLSG